MYKFLFLTVTLILSGFSAQAGSLVPSGECALIVAARKTLPDVRNYVNTISDKRHLKVYYAQNGWYAISIGTLKPHEVDPVMKNWKSSGKIPSDSYCSKGKKYIRIVSGFGNSGSSAVSSVSNSTNPLIEVMDKAPLDLMRICLNVVLFGFNCFDIKRMDASANIISFDAYVASQKLDLTFKKSNSDPNLFIGGPLNGKACKLRVYDRPQIKDENSDYIWAALAYRECEGSWIVVIVPKSPQARAEAYKSRLRSNAWDAFNRSF